MTDEVATGRNGMAGADGSGGGLVAGPGRVASGWCMDAGLGGAPGGAGCCGSVSGCEFRKDPGADDKDVQVRFITDGGAGMFVAVPTAEF